MRNNTVVGQGYTIPLCDIIRQIYVDDHPDELIDTEEVPTWKDGLEQIATEIEYARTQIFYFEYPNYGDSNDKKELETHILETYYTRDICCDSVMRWVMYLKDRLHDIMPKYVALYNAQMELIASDILDPYHLTETKDVTSDKTILIIKYALIYLSLSAPIKLFIMKLEGLLYPDISELAISLKTSFANTINLNW